ncbi:MAG TPA: Slp family lipoprotein [Deltaproteobacteria bacterium]|jgi:outer membrane lipoprotein|nr:Slp family lipoprotein [Deltaproteobacteria bacterium]HOI06854.1 Slp family lipoprotein [Deltaproteobacteria bacterium]
MKTSRYLLVAAFLASTVLAAGCAGPIRSELSRKADQSITVDKVLSKPEAYGNALVLWGGMIVNTKPQEGHTSVEISERPLDSQKRPREGALSRGRFLARQKGFLDPSVFDDGRSITIVGRITGTETGRIGDFTYTYPVVAIEEYYLWSPRPVYVYYPYYPYPSYYPYSPLRYPWWYY